jgi:hypothetical protein|tara:strand:+ start:9 stop:272 length:264 start_codon:yes stop_codon:yes gene_type:complete
MVDSLDGDVDFHGNFWPSARPIRSELSAEIVAKYSDRYSNFAVDIESDEVYALGLNREALSRGFRDRNLDEVNFQIEPVFSERPILE